MSKRGPLTRIFYFGCLGDVGHYLWDHMSMSTRLVPTDFPCDWHELDGRFLTVPKSVPGIEGYGSLVHLNAWTILSFWDRSVDTRPGSLSVFVIHGTLTFDEAVASAQEWFPRIWQRYKFQVQLYVTDATTSTKPQVPSASVDELLARARELAAPAAPAVLSTADVLQGATGPAV